MEWTVDWGLRARMAATLLLTGAVAVLGVWAVYGVVRALLWILVYVEEGPGAAGEIQRLVAAAVAAAYLLGVLLVEVRIGNSLGLPEVDARAADPETYPRLTALVDRLAKQFDLPRPEVAVTDDLAPLAMTTGLGSGSATLVVSTALLAVLDDAELEAVLAHELAHVRNRDAAVMTVASMPMVVADALRERAPSRLDLADHGDGGGVNPFLYPVAVAFWLLGRFLVSLLSRYRELAADRAAAAVTGSPAALASALRTLADAEARPIRDRRTRSAVDAFAIVPEEPPEPVRLGPDGGREPLFADLRRAMQRVFRTHPSLERRLEELGELSARLERSNAG